MICVCSIILFIDAEAVPFWAVLVVVGVIMFPIYRFYKRNDRWEKIMKRDTMSPFMTYLPVGLFFLLIIASPLVIRLVVQIFGP